MTDTIPPFDKWVEEYQGMKDRIKQLEDAINKIDKWVKNYNGVSLPEIEEIIGSLKT